MTTSNFDLQALTQAQNHTQGEFNPLAHNYWETFGRINDSQIKRRFPYNKIGRITSADEYKAKMNGVMIDVYRREDKKSTMEIK